MRKVCPTCKKQINPDSVVKHIFHLAEAYYSSEAVETPEERKETREERHSRLSDHWSELE